MSLVPALLLSASTTMSSSLGIKKIDVVVALDAIGDTAAARAWASVETDLELAIASRALAQFAGDGVSVEVDLDETVLHVQDGTHGGVLRGDLAIKQAGETLISDYTLTATAPANAGTSSSGGADRNNRSPYDILISRFADKVASKVR